MASQNLLKPSGVTTRKKSKTNETTAQILKFLTFDIRAFVWRNNVLPVPLPGGRGFRPGSKLGVPDIIGILPEWGKMAGGTFIGVEVKTGKDKVRPEQEGFHTQARKLGAIILIVKDFKDFETQWQQLTKNL